MKLFGSHGGESRIEVSDDLSRRRARALARDRDVEVVQAAKPLPDDTWRLVNDEICARRPDIEIRVYGHYGEECDLRLARLLPNVRKLSADCLQQAIGVEALGELPLLEELHVGIFDLTSFEFLEGLPTGLRSLGLHDTRSKKPDLSSLSRFPRLRTLYLEGQRKNIEVLARLSELEDLTLRSITVKEGLGFLRGLDNLWSLDIKLGGTRDLGALEGMGQIRYLELWQIRGLEDVGVVGSLSGLQYLFLQSLPRVRELPDFSRCIALRRIHLERLHGLSDLSAITTVPHLEEFRLVDASNFDVEQVEPVLRMKSLRSASVAMGADRKNKRLVELCERLGKTAVPQAPFEFR